MVDRTYLVQFTGLGALQALEKMAILNYKKMPSEANVMRDITLTSLPSKASVMHDAKSWSY